MAHLTSIRSARSSFLLYAGLALALFTTACSSSDTELDPRAPCPPDSPGGCVQPTGGGSGSGGNGGSGGSGSGGGMATNDLKGNLGVLNEVSFTNVGPYIGAATIITPSGTSGNLEAPYGPSKTTFDMPDVPSGLRWFFVRDEENGGTGIFSTFSARNVPVTGPVTLPVVDRQVLSAIAGMLPAPVTVDAGRAQLILKVIRNGQPLPGISLATSQPNGVVAYDTGVGLYSNSATLTGPAGVILVFNLDAAATSEIKQLQLSDVNGQVWNVDVQVQAAAATYAGVSL